MDSYLHRGIRSVVLERLNLEKQAVLTRELFNDPGIAIRTLFSITDNMIIELRDYIWTEHLETDSHFVTYPATWWDHFKQGAIPTFCRWLGLKVHLHSESVTFERKALYPNLHHISKDNQYYSIIHEHKTVNTNIKGGDNYENLPPY